MVDNSNQIDFQSSGKKEKEKPGDGDDGYLEPNWHKTFGTFEGMGFEEEVLRGIYAYGYTKPNEI